MLSVVVVFVGVVVSEYSQDSNKATLLPSGANAPSLQTALTVLIGAGVDTATASLAVSLAVWLETSRKAWLWLEIDSDQSCDMALSDSRLRHH